MKSVFNPADVIALIYRVNKLSPESKPQWGKMSVSQMLAHLNVAYEMVYTDKYPRPNLLMRLVLTAFVKQTVVGPKPYKRNSPTAPAFLIKEEKDFNAEKTRLLSHVNQTQQLGEAYFHNRVSNSFGKLTAAEWNVMFYKHLDHHLTQFGV